MNLRGDVLWLICGHDAPGMPQEVEHRQIRCDLAVRQTAPAQIRQPTPAQAMLELYEQARLANARCAYYPYQLAAAGLDLGKQRVQGRQLVPTSTNGPRR